jgi:Fe-S cluster biosynthesis and repair protein YggX
MAADTNARIEQFKKMADADPDNELGHFSLGKAYLEAGRPADAAQSFDRALSLNPNLSKGYHLWATALLRLNQKQQAIEQLTRGVGVATGRGDVMARNDMVRMLQEIGAPVPDAPTDAGRAQQPVGEGQVQCKRCGQVAPKLAKAPFRSEFGQEIFENICANCWRDAIAMGTKVINELRLPLNDPQAQRLWDQHIREFLNLSR